jgi:hypothetical protein
VAPGDRIIRIVRCPATRPAQGSVVMSGTDHRSACPARDDLAGRANAVVIPLEDGLGR